MTDANDPRNNLNGRPNNTPNGNPQDGRLPPRPALRYLPSEQTGGTGIDKSIPINRKGSPQPAGEKIERPARRSRRDRRRTTGGARTSPAAPKKAHSGGRKLKIASSSTPQLRATSARTAADRMSADRASTDRASTDRTSTARTAADRTSAGRTAKATASRTPAKRPIGRSSSSGSPVRTRRRNARRSFTMPVPLLYLSRLVVAGLGIAAIGGTLLAVRPNNTSPSVNKTEPVLAISPSRRDFPISLRQEIGSLKADIEGLPNTYPSLTSKVFYTDVDTGRYVNVRGQEAIAAASTIKLPILLAFFEEVDAGNLELNQIMAINQEQVAGGSGEMQTLPPGTQFTVLEVATNMIVNSDNTATNMMIDLLGGSLALNQRFRAYGLEDTQLTSPLPDLTGTNTTSAKDLVHTLLLISQGDILTMRSRDRILGILNRTYNKSLIAAPIEEKGAVTFNKTGDIESVLGDTALVDLPNGKRYAIAVLVERPTNDNRAVDLIRDISARTFQVAQEVPRPAVSPPFDTDDTGRVQGTADGRSASPTSPSDTANYQFAE